MHTVCSADYNEIQGAVVLGRRGTAEERVSFTGTRPTFHQPLRRLRRFNKRAKVRRTLRMLGN